MFESAIAINQLNIGNDLRYKKQDKTLQKIVSNNGNEQEQQYETQ